MKSHRLRLLDLLLFEDFDDLLLLEVDVPPFLPFDTLEVSASSESRKENYNFWNPLPFGYASAILSFFDVHATQNNIGGCHRQPNKEKIIFLTYCSG